MASLIAERPVPGLEVIDLSRVSAVALEPLWEREIRHWRETLGWDVRGAIRGLKRAVERGSVAGKVALAGEEVLGYGYFGVEGRRGVVSGLVAPHGSSIVGEALVSAVLEEMESVGVGRVETQFMGFEAPWLTPCFEARGFETCWREFLRRPVTGLSSASSLEARASEARGVLVLPWSGWNLSEMAQLMEQAHRGGVDASVNELYRSTEGCRLLLNNIARQRGCGEPLLSASMVARDGATDRAAGFALVTEIAPGHGHLAQIAVAPAYQRRGVGTLLLANVLRQLEASECESISLMYSTANRRAGSLYRAAAFEPVYRFPVFTRDA